MGKVPQDVIAVNCFSSGCSSEIFKERFGEVLA